jgi:hypothetical protein
MLLLPLIVLSSSQFFCGIITVMHVCACVRVCIQVYRCACLCACAWADMLMDVVVAAVAVVEVVGKQDAKKIWCGCAITFR